MTCVVPNCDMGAGAPYKTEKVEAAMAWAMLQTHIALAHNDLTPADTGKEPRPQAERVKRPMLTLTGKAITQEDYENFKYLYGQYKLRLGDTSDSPSRLRECLAEDVSKMLFSILGTEITKLSESQLLDKIIAHCVTRPTVQARMTELHRIKQEPGQPIQTFLSHLKSKASQCEMTLVCSKEGCNTTNSYSEPVILGLFINGVHDLVLQQNLLAEQDITLHKAVKLSVARETAQRSQGILDSNQQEENNQGIGETCCNLQSEPPTGFLWRRVPVGPSKFLPPALSLPEEVTLASLVYSKGNNKWVDRAKDDGANKLYVLIKPMLDQWAQLHEDPTCTPSKYKMKKTQAAGVADTGASVLCSGLNLMSHLGLEEKNLIKTSIIITAANEEKMDVLGYIPVTVKVVGHPNKESTQALYITRQLKTLFISRSCLQELGCLPSSWPYPPLDTETCTPITLDEWLQDYFKSSTSNTWPPQVLPGRSGQESSSK